MKLALKTLFLSAISVVLLSSSISTAFASTPYLTATSSGNGNVQITINSGNSYSGINLSYRPQGTSLWTQITNIGYTDQSGYFSQNVSIGYTGTQMDVYVTVGGVQSATVTVNGGGGCTYGNCGNQITFSPSSVSLSVGQSTSVSIYGGTYGSYYVSNNSNSSVASATVSGSTLNVYGNMSGSSTVSVCSTGNSSQCGTIYITVGGTCTYGNCGTGQITFSPSTLNLSVGQSQNVTIYNSNTYLNPNSGAYYNDYYISSNSNSSAVSASISGTTMYVNGNNSGSASIMVCSYSSGNTCGTLYVTVGGTCTYGNCGNQITFSQNNVSLSYGQSSIVTIYGGTYGSYYVSSNSNGSAISATISGSTITLYGNNSGSATILVCSTGNSSQCGTLYATANGGCTYGNCGGQITFSQTNPTLSVGQSLNVSIYGGNYGSYYLSSNSNSGVVTAGIAGSNLNLYGNYAGTTTISVCSSGYSAQCGTLYVTVSGYGGQQISFSQNNLTLTSGQTSNVSIYGGSYSSYYISNNSNSGAVSATISGSSINLYGNNSGSATITVCSTGNSSQCGTLYATVNGGTTSNNVTISDNYFTPNTITVSAGTTVTWRNNGSMSHTVTADNGAFNSGTITPGSSFSVTITAPGTYIYHCQFHSGMTGTVIVTGSVLGATTYPNGTLINDNGTIFITYKNTKVGFANYPAFTGLGFKLVNAILASSSGLNSSGYVVTTANAQHPWGTWVKSGNTIYFVHENGLIPISSYATFLNNGGNLALVVNANSFDMSLTQLSIMVPADSRLQ